MCTCLRLIYSVVIWQDKYVSHLFRYQTTHCNTLNTIQWRTALFSNVKHRTCSHGSQFFIVSQQKQQHVRHAKTWPDGGRNIILAWNWKTTRKTKGTPSEQKIFNIKKAISLAFRSFSLSSQKFRKSFIQMAKEYKKKTLATDPTKC